MPRGKPSYRLHKPSGQAVVTINGRDIYLGKHGSQESLAEYQHIMDKHLNTREKHFHGVSNADPKLPEFRPIQLSRLSFEPLVYFLGDKDGVCVYVGQSVNGVQRIINHIQAKRMIFDVSKTCFVPCPVGLLTLCEKRAIARALPRYNVAGKTYEQRINPGINRNWSVEDAAFDVSDFLNRTTSWRVD